ncbi:MAG: Unknown protein [uncultured Sulfurovum sp.]|uniref:Uncharacterized protein n=1 Tax=uncultured Sulfurovum sp. TaxID=269237 RepID=A0A6S6TFZ5_9BACT|nr:MAG: Unknown protein [uncultured Sulfurovum sp.]
MKKYKFILGFFLVLVFLLWSYYDYESLRKDKKAFLSDLNITVIDMNEKLLENNESMYDGNFTLWDMKKSSILESREAKQLLLNDANKSKSDKDKERNLNLKNRVICLEKVCWEFLGIVTINNDVVVTLLSKNTKDKKAKLENFHVNDMLLENVRIIEIKEEGMRLMNLEKNKEINLKLFEVDIEQYRPKKSIKGKNE